MKVENFSLKWIQRIGNIFNLNDYPILRILVTMNELTQGR